MANYKDIRGTTIRNSAGNLSGAVKGELFYDSTNRDFKYQYPAVTTAGTWRTANSINTARGGMQGGGIQTSAIVAGGALAAGLAGKAIADSRKKKKKDVKESASEQKYKVRVTDKSYR